MIRAHAPFHGARFIGNTGKNIVHDLLFEKSTNCGIDEITIDCIKTFSPDTLEQAKKEGYNPCKYCLPFLHPPP